MEPHGQRADEDEWNGQQKCDSPVKSVEMWARPETEGTGKCGMGNRQQETEKTGNENRVTPCLPAGRGNG